MVKNLLLVSLALVAGGCASTRAARTEGCTLLKETTAPVFDARLLEKRVSQDASQCYVEGVAPSRDMAEQQLKIIEARVESGCGIAARRLTAAVRAERGYAFAVTVSGNPNTDACEAKAASTDHGIGSSVDPSSRRMNPPKYPVNAAKLGVQGTAMLVVAINATGEQLAVVVEKSSGNSELDAAAAAAVQRWQFNPAFENGSPVPSFVRIPVDFVL